MNMVNAANKDEALPLIQRDEYYTISTTPSLFPTIYSYAATNKLCQIRFGGNITPTSIIINQESVFQIRVFLKGRLKWRTVIRGRG